MCIGMELHFAALSTSRLPFRPLERDASLDQTDLMLLSAREDERSPDAVRNAGGNSQVDVKVGCALPSMDSRLSMP
jgi:hypothetical protein